MTDLRQAKVDGIADDPPLAVGDPTGDAGVLVLGWGSTYGPIAAAVRGSAPAVAGWRAHLTHLNPFPANTGDVVRGYRRPHPEMNAGRLALLIRGTLPSDARSYARVRGLPFTTNELVDAIAQAADQA